MWVYALEHSQQRAASGLYKADLEFDFPKELKFRIAYGFKTLGLKYSNIRIEILWGGRGVGYLFLVILS